MNYFIMYLMLMWARRLVLGNTTSGADSSRLEERYDSMLCV